MACEQEFINRLRNQGLRVTPQRELVLLALHDSAALATAEELHAWVQARNAAVDISTVYRTLDLLEQLQFVVSLPHRTGERRYELIGTHPPHLHLVCRECGAVQAVSGSALQAVLRTLREQYAFQADVEAMCIHGLCSACQGKASDSQEIARAADEGN